MLDPSLRPLLKGNMAAQGLGDAFTPEARDAWATVYGILAATMQAGAAEPLAQSA